MHAILMAAVSWVFREIVIKFAVLTAVLALVVFLVPFAVQQLQGFIVVNALTNAFASLPAGIWYFLDLFRLDYGVPLCLAAIVSRFLIRRLPVIG